MDKNIQKTSIRFFDNIPVRSVWDEESSKWWFCAVDIAEALTKSKNPRSYWNKLKSRKAELSTTEIEGKRWKISGRCHTKYIWNHDKE